MHKLYFNMPIGHGYGWAVCGRNMIQELDKITDVRYVGNPKYVDVLKDSGIKDYIDTITEVPNGKAFNYLQTIDNYDGQMLFNGDKNVGYLFYEKEDIEDDLLKQLRDYDIVATGSHWNTDVVKKYGINAVTIHQGVDTDIFKPMPKKLFEDKFIVFSGGKLEHRKAQDIAAFAVGQLQRKYKDMYFMTSWSNLFNEKAMHKRNLENVMLYLDESRVIKTDLMGHQEMTEYIAETDVGLFPNKFEGGTNLVMMEYMACGKPVIANYATGQKDVLSNHYAYLVEGKTDTELIDACMESLENAYRNRELLSDLGTKAREAMKPFTWAKTAKEFLDLYE